MSLRIALLAGEIETQLTDLPQEFRRQAKISGNPEPPKGTKQGMSSNSIASCDRIREAISARLDGEEPGVPDRLIDEHVAECPSCNGFLDGVQRLNPELRVLPSPVMRDLTPGVLASIGETEPAFQRRLAMRLRAGLVLAAVVQIVLAIPALLLGHDDGGPVHLARHEGSFEVALAASFLLAAWRPARAAALTVVVGALMVCMVVTASVDLGLGHTTFVDELDHLPLIAGYLMMWPLTHPFRAAPREVGHAAG